MPPEPRVRPIVRSRSRRCSDSTRMTSAPRAPSQAVECGAERIHPKSATRTPLSGRLPAVLRCAGRRSPDGARYGASVGGLREQLRVVLAEARRGPVLARGRAREQCSRARTHVGPGVGVFDGLDEPAVLELRRLDHLGGGVDREARDADVECHLVQLGARVLRGPHVHQRLDGVAVEPSVLGGEEGLARRPLGAAHELLEALPPVVEVVRGEEDITIATRHEEVEVALLAPRGRGPACARPTRSSAARGWRSPPGRRCRRAGRGRSTHAGRARPSPPPQR